MKATDVLGGRYRLDDRLAFGGMGEVWRAHDEVLGRDVAVKLLRRDLAEDDSFVERFRDEARHTASLSHPGIASVHDYAESDGASYLVMELVEGEPLSAVIAAQGALPLERTLDIVAQVAVALQAAHDAGVIHRDIKPGNLMVRPDGVVKVTDFGIARAVEATATRTQTGTVVGTAYYMSPEAARGETTTPASDVYALGVVAYECLAGERPFTAANPVAVATAHLHDVPPPLPSHVPRDVVRLVFSCLVKDPALRPTPASAVAEQALGLKAALAPTMASTTLMPALSDGEPPTVAAPIATGPTEDWRGQWRSNAPGQRTVRRNLILAAALAVLLGFFLLKSCDNSNPYKRIGTPSPTATPTVTTVQVVGASYLGRPAAEVVGALTALGLRPVKRTVITTDEHLAPGTVTAITPTGAVPRGSTVTVTVAQRPPERKGHGKDKGGND